MPNVKKVDCPKCGGYGYDGIEEDSGRPYSCYFCGESGLVDADVAAAHQRDEAWSYFVSVEKSIQERAALGVPAGWGYYYDDYEGELVLVPPPEVRAAQLAARYASAHLYPDDIPF